MHHQRKPLFLLAVVEGMLVIGVLSLSTLVDDGFGSDPGTGVTTAGSGAAIILAGMFAVGLYDWRFVGRMDEVIARLAVAVSLALGAIGGLVYVSSTASIPGRQVAIAVALIVVTLALARLAFGRLADLDRFRSRALVLGTGVHARQVAQLDNSSRQCRIRIAGFVDYEGTSASVAADRIRPAPASLIELIRADGIDQVIVALDDRRGRLPLDDLIKARLAGVTVVDYQAFCERVHGRIDLDALRSNWFLYSGGFRNSRFDRRLKRAFDIGVSTTLLLLSAPILLLTAIAIRLDSSGPVLDRQRRVGLRGKPFTLIQFRSMTAGAEAGGMPQWATRNDPRITAVGFFIRKLRIDKTPQLFNVLKGEMSIVGPRPERPRFVDVLSKDFQFHVTRLSMKPGVTGWAQVHRDCGASLDDARLKLEYDLFYIKYFSILRDCLILAQSVRVVLWAEGAR